MPSSSKSAFGAKANIETAKTQGLINQYDILYLDSQEIGWLDKNGNTIMSTVRTQSDIEVNGVTGLGIENGESIPAGKSIDEIIKMLVQKAIPATYIKPTLSLTAPKSGSYEVGTIITDTLNAEFVQNDSQGMIKLALYDPEENLLTSTINQSSLGYEIEINIAEGVQTYKAEANYRESVVKQDNLGNDSSENSFGEGSLSASKTYTGKWNAFYGAGSGSVEVSSSNVRDLANKKLGPAANTVFDIKLEVGDQWAMFAYPSNLRDVQQVMYVETNDINCAANFTKSIITVQGANGAEGRSYKVYIYQMATAAEAPMTFRVTI